MLKVNIGVVLVSLLLTLNIFRKKKIKTSNLKATLVQVKSKPTPRAKCTYLNSDYAMQLVTARHFYQNDPSRHLHVQI